MAPWGVRQGWSGVGEGVAAAAPLRDTRAAPLAEDPPDEAPPPRRPRALSPSLPNLPGDIAEARVPPAPWGDAARDGAAAGTTRAPAKRARAAPVSVAARVLALVDAHERLPPSPFERWRERLRDDAENRAPRSGAGHAPGRAAGPSGAGGGDTRGIADVLGTDWTRKNAPPVAPLPSLTWDQHAVFLQFPPTRRVTADDLPRGLAPATLTELYRRVEREQKRFFAHAARGAPLPGATDGENDKAESRKARYREIAGDANHVVAEKRWRARLAEAAFFVRPKSAGALQSGGVAPRRATAMPVVVALERELSAALNPKHSETPETLLEIGADLDLDPDPDPSRDENDSDSIDAGVSLRRGDALAPPFGGAGVQDGTSTSLVLDAVSSLSPFCFVSSRDVERGKNTPQTTNARPLDAVMTAAALACFASHAPDRRRRAWEVPFRVDAYDDSPKGTKRTIVRFFDPLPSRDLSVSGTRARASAYWDFALREHLRADARAGAPKPTARCFTFARSNGSVTDDGSGSGSGSGSHRFAVVATMTIDSAIAVADYAANEDEENATEAFRWEDAARAWAASVLAPRTGRTSLEMTDGALGDGSRPSSAMPQRLATVARVAVADGTVVDVQAVDRARAARMAVDPPPEPPTLAEWRAEETFGSEEPLPERRERIPEAAEAAEAAEDASAGGAAAEPWFHRGFDPELAAATVHRVLRSVRETCAAPGRYVMAHRAGEAVAELYRDADADASAAESSAGDASVPNPASMLPRRRGRPQTGPGPEGSAFFPGGPRAAKRRRPRGGARGGAFGGVADGEDVDVSEDDDPQTAGRSSEASRLASVVPARTALGALPLPSAVLPRSRRGPEPGAVYDFHASFHVELVSERAASSAARETEREKQSETERDKDDEDEDAPEVVPLSGAQRPPPGQIPFTFAPRGEPPQPGARRARKMWTSLLAPPHVTEDAYEYAGTPPEDARGQGPVGDNNSRDASGAASASKRLSPRDDGAPIPGARYCHKFAHLGTCTNSRCPFPHVSLAEARASAAGGGAEARARRAAYGNLVESAVARRRNWAGT